MTEAPQAPGGVDLSKPSPARLYDYYLGGEHNFPVDREAAERIKALMPELSDAAWANRGFHQRAAGWMAAQGVRQFVDVGSGLPTRGNTHEVVRGAQPGARVVYVDVDPMVAVHAAELLSADGDTAVVTRDLRDPDGVLGDPGLRALIDFSEPAGLLMTAVMHFVAPAEDPWGLVRQYVGALAPGSYLALSHVTADGLPSRTVQVGREVYERSTERIFLRPMAQVERFFDGLDLVAPHERAEPGLCYVGEWGAEEPALADSDGSRVLYCGVARRP